MQKSESNETKAGPRESRNRASIEYMQSRDSVPFGVP